MKSIINKNSIGVYVNGKLETVMSDHPNFLEIKEAIKQDNETLVSNLIDVKTALKQDGITEKDGNLYLGEELISNHLTKRMFDLREEGFDPKNILNFIKNLYENPSNRAVNELYTFLEHFALPITEDGCFLAYKAVRNDYMDIYSGTIRNKVGDKPTIHRWKVDEDKDKGCSTGLHVGAIGYVKQYGHVSEPPVGDYGNRIMIVKVNPKDAVSVPLEYSCQKLRTCAYEVVSELQDYEKLLSKALYTSDASEAKPIRSPKVNKEVAGEDDSFYFDGKRDGRLDCEAGIPFVEPDSDSKKYNRGYRNGYHRN